jgi:hypothetical protein
MIKKISKNNTKAEILKAFMELQKETSKLQAELKKALDGNGQKNNISNQSFPSDKRADSNNGNKKNAVNSNNNSHHNIEKILDSLEQLQIGFGSAASNLSEQLITEASKLSELQISVSEAKHQLYELHGLEKIEDKTLNSLIESYKENSESYENRYNQRQEALEQEIQDFKKAWQKEQEIHQEQKNESNEIYQKEQKREAEKYYYDLELKRNLDKEKYVQHKKALYKELEEKLENQKRTWQEREEEISKRVEEYEIAKKKVEKHQQEIEKKKKEAREKGQRISLYKSKITSDLRSKEIEGERRNYQLQIKNLEHTIQNNKNNIDNLSGQLDAVLKQVQDLAVKAIEGSSNRNAFDAIKEVTNELAKNQQKSK